jgi:hypothetical protein
MNIDMQKTFFFISIESIGNIHDICGDGHFKRKYLNVIVEYNGYK